MKKFTAIFLMLVPFLQYSCKKIDRFTHFSMEYEELFTIPATDLINVPVNFLSPDIESNSSYEFEINDTREDLIEEIKLSSLTFEIKQPDSISFGYLKSIHVYIVAEGMDGRVVAGMDDVPADVSNVLSLETWDDNLMDFVKKNNFALVLNTLTDEAITTEHQVKMRAVFAVDARILGQ